MYVMPALWCLLLSAAFPTGIGAQVMSEWAFGGVQVHMDRTGPSFWILQPGLWIQGQPQNQHGPQFQSKGALWRINQRAQQLGRSAY